MNTRYRIFFGRETGEIDCRLAAVVGDQHEEGDLLDCVALDGDARRLRLRLDDGRTLVAVEGGDVTTNGVRVGTWTGTERVMDTALARSQP